MNASTSAGSVQIMVLGWRCQVTESNAVRRISSPVERPNRLSTKSSEDHPSTARDTSATASRCRGPLVAASSDTTGPQHAGELRGGPTGFRDVVQHVVRHDDVERAATEGKVLRVAGTGFGQLHPRQSGHGAGGRLDHALRQIGQGELEAGEERRRADPQQSGAATNLEHPPTLGPIDLTHEPIEPGHVRPRVLGVQRNAGVEVAGVLVLPLPQVVPVGAQTLPARHDGGGTVLIICNAGWSAPHSSGISSSGRKPQPK